jgi:hypothetical protein
MPILRALLTLTLMSLACHSGLPRSQFGEYHRTNRHLVLADGETLTVYRVKTWTFEDGAPPALQIEYEPSFSVADSDAVREEARKLWPAFMPYVEAIHLTRAIVTATNFRLNGLWPVAWTSTNKSYGFVASRDTAGKWTFVGDPSPLPPAESPGIPRILNPDGSHMPFVGVTIQP